MIATVHLHVLHRTLDPLGIVLAALSLAIVIVLVGFVAAWLIRRRAPVPAPGLPGAETSTLDT